MENVEHADVPANTNSGTNKNEPKIIVNTESVIETDLKQYTGTDEFLVIAICNKEDEQSREDSSVADEGIPNVIEMESITNNDDVPETKRPTNDEEGNIRKSIEAPITIIGAGGSTTTQTDDSAEMVTSNEKPTSKTDKVSLTKAVGSLGLLIQYISSSDDEDNESNSDNTTLDAQAKDLLDKVMAKGDYRVVHDEDPDELVNCLQFIFFSELFLKILFIHFNSSELNRNMKAPMLNVLVKFRQKRLTSRMTKI